MYFKRNKDIFTSFSKLDEMAYATIFMEKTEIYGRTSNSSTVHSSQQASQDIRKLIKDQFNDQTESIKWAASVSKNMSLKASR